MGIARGMIKLLMREAGREGFKGVVLTAGRQDIYATSRDLKKWADEMRFHLKSGIEMTISDKKGFSEKGYITDSALFCSLGFDKVESMDYDDFEHCTIVHDLNKDVPAELHNKYDLICDGGTSEHILNFPKALENFNKMLKTGGRLIHVLPVSNYVDHGFYMFSPTLFYDYYSANKWNIIDSLFIRYSHKENELCRIYAYTPGCLDRYSSGGFNRGMYEVFFVTQKTEESTFNAPVQQGRYIKAWNSTAEELAITDISSAKRLAKKFLSLLPENLERNLLALYVRIYFKVYFKIPPRFHLKLIAKY